MRSLNGTGLLSGLGEAQRQWWDGWFRFLGGATLSRGVQTAGLWQSGLDVWQKSVEVTLDAQRNAAQLLSGGFAEPVTEAAQDSSDLVRQSARWAESRAAVLALGASASLTKTVSDADIVTFAALSGDVNPVHLDDAYAATTRFGERIAHGMLSAGLISAVLGTKLPGPGTVYLSQTLKFRAPVKVGDTVTATATVVAQKEGKPIYTLETVCKNQDGVTVLKGEAVILYDA